MTGRSETTSVSQVALHDENGAVVAQVNGLTLRAIDSESSAQRDRKFYQMAWEALPAANVDEREDEVLIFCEDGAESEPLLALLHAHAVKCTLVLANAKPSHANGSS